MSNSMSNTRGATVKNDPKEYFEAIIFDLDGTLLDTEALSDKAMLKVYDPWLSDDICRERREAGYLLPWELKKQILGLRGSEWAPLVIKYAKEHWNVDEQALSPNELWSQWECRLNELCHEVQLCPGAMEVVQKFAKEGITMGIATSSRMDSFVKKSSRHETVFSKLPIVVTGDHPAVHNGKPAPDIYLEAARQLNVTDLAKCLVFEDALSGVRSGKRAGCVVVAVPDSRFSAEEKAVFEQEADLILGSLQEFSWDAIAALL